MQDRHSNRQQYFNEQAYTTQNYVMPFIRKVMPITPDMKVLEIGCGEGGNLKPFLDMGCEVIGIDLSASKIEKGKRYFENHPKRNKLQFIARDIYEVEDFEQAFDLVFLRDTLEHIHNQERFMAYSKKFLKPGGKMFLGFPPWQNPYGGHQQICRNKYLSKLPFFHLLPRVMYKSILEKFGETEKRVEELMEIRDTRITIERFRRILKKENYHIDREVLYFINPNYEVKFKMKPRIQSGLITAIPYVRNFLVTTCYYLISYPRT